MARTPGPEQARRAAEAAASQAGPHVIRLSDVAPERVTWLWQDYLPIGKLVVLDGDPGLGKSMLTIDLGARVSTGSPMPDGTAPVKGAVLILSAEDGLEDTIRPRIDAAYGDPDQIITITEISYAGADGPASRPVKIPDDLPAIESVILEHGVVLVVIDVLMAYLNGDVNSHRDQDVRRALHPAAMMAQRTGCCVIVLRHLNKSAGLSAVYRGGGSIGIVGAARAGFMVGLDPSDDTGQRRVLAPVKCNLGPEPPALAYRLVPDDLHGCAHVVWDGVSEHRASGLLAEPGDPEERTERDEAAAWLIGYLTDHGGEARAGDVFKAGRPNGHAERTLKRARKKAGVTSTAAGFGQGTVWRLAPSGPHPGHPGQGKGTGLHGPDGGPDGPAGDASPGRHCAGCGKTIPPDKHPSAIYCDRRCKNAATKRRARKTSTEGKRP
jgi:predicted nucleic acid-binding Zn ribbon protein